MASRRQQFTADSPVSSTSNASFPASKEAQPRIIPAQRPATDPSDTSPTVPPAVIIKLAIFTALMVIAPIGSYFLLVKTVFAGNTTYAGASAAVVANVVLIAYIIVAVREDQGEQVQEKGRKKE